MKISPISDYQLAMSWQEVMRELVEQYRVRSKRIDPAAGTRTLSSFPFAPSVPSHPKWLSVHSIRPMVASSVSSRQPASRKAARKDASVDVSRIRVLQADTPSPFDRVRLLLSVPTAELHGAPDRRRSTSRTERCRRHHSVVVHDRTRPTHGGPLRPQSPLVLLRSWETQLTIVSTNTVRNDVMW